MYLAIKILEDVHILVVEGGVSERQGQGSILALEWCITAESKNAMRNENYQNDVAVLWRPTCTIILLQFENKTRNAFFFAPSSRCFPRIYVRKE